MRHLLLIPLLLLTLGCPASEEVAEYEPPYPPQSHQLSKVIADARPAFHLDPAIPFKIEFGRGSGMRGLDTVKIDHDGQVVLHRLSWTTGGGQTATFELPGAPLAKILDSIEANRLLHLARGYHADVVDGTQWVLWIRQGAREKAVYFDNHFPEPIVRFAEQLDDILKQNSRALRWRNVSRSKARDHARDLWDSIQR